jgi:hypothetical protein
MTLAPQVLPESPDVIVLPERGTGERRLRRQARRRLAREQVAVAIVIILAVIATLVILGQQWLDSGGSGVSNGAATRTLIGGST